MDQKDKVAYPSYHKIEPDSSDNVNLREIQKTVEYYGNKLYELPMEISRISLKQEEILTLLRDIQRRMEEIERRKPCSGKIRNQWSKDPTSTSLFDAKPKELQPEDIIRIMKGKYHE